MIGYLKGEVIEKRLGSVVVLSGGVGYLVFVPSSELQSLEIDGGAELYIEPVGKDGNVFLYGFCDKASRYAFSKLIGVSGVGPRSAMAILDLYSAGKVKSIIESGDADAIAKVSGIGKKTAQRVVIDMKGKLDLIEGEGEGGVDMDFVETLEALGYGMGDIRRVIDKVDSDAPTQEKVKTAIRLLSNGN